MIRIGDYFITVEGNPINYIVRKGSSERDKKGRYATDPLGYFSSLRTALNFVRKQVIGRVVSEASRTLPDAIRAIEKANKEFNDLLTAAGLED